MKKLVKILAGIVITLVVLLLVFVLTLPLTIGPIVKTAAAVGGPKVLGVPVSVGSVSLRPFAGTLTIAQVKIGNPKGYAEDNAFAVEKIDVVLNIRSLMSDTIIVNKVAIDAPAISFESREGRSNFDTLLAHAKKSSAEEKAKTPGAKKAGKKVIIEVFTLNGAKVAYSSSLTLGRAVPLMLPSVTVKDIGKDSGGASVVEAVTKVMDGIVAGLSQAAAEVAGKANDVLKGTLKGAGDVTQGATDALKGAAGGATDAAKGATDALKGAAGGASDAAKDAAKSLKKLFK